MQALDVKNSTIVGNFGGADGGGISSVGSLRVFDSAIRENATQNSAGGGGIGAADTRGRASDTGITRSTIANNQGSGVKLVGGNLTVTDSTISGNTTSGSGGGIFAGESVPQVMLTRTEISHNAAAVDGGGIQRVGGTNTTLAVTDNRIIENKAGRDGGGINISVPSSFAAKFGNTTVQGNSAGRAGGGIAKHGAGLISLSSSTLNDNMAAGNGGGLAADDGGTWIFESTVSGNTAGDLGGGLWTSKGATLDFSTIAKNTANAAGGGVLSSYGPVTLNHTIVGTNTAPIARDLAGLLGAPIIPKFSLIGSNAGSGLAEAPLGSPDVNGNLIGGPTHGVIDPKLGPLTNNGGLTQTHGLLVGSPAINAGDPSAIAGVNIVPFYDQRGVPFTRVYGGQIDIGAFEAQAALPGDYNTDGVVNAADYVVWRKAASTANKQGDGNGDSSINSTDYSMWRADFGAGQVSNVAAVGASVVARSVELPASAVIADLAITEVELPTAVSGQSGTVASAAVSSTGRVARVLYRPEARAANSLDALHPELASDRFAPARRSALETDDDTKPIDGGAEASNDEAAVLEDAFEALAVLG